MSADALLRMVRVDLRTCQLQALASFVEWLIERDGERAAAGVWERSALLRMVNNNDTTAVGPELMRWVYTGDLIDPVIVARRIRERELWEGRL